MYKENQPFIKPRAFFFLLPYFQSAVNRLKENELKQIHTPDNQNSCIFLTNKKQQSEEISMNICQSSAVLKRSWKGLEQMI